MLLPAALGCAYRRRGGTIGEYVDSWLDADCVRGRAAAAARTCSDVRLMGELSGFLGESMVRLLYKVISRMRVAARACQGLRITVRCGCPCSSYSCLCIVSSRVVRSRVRRKDLGCFKVKRKCKSVNFAEYSASHDGDAAPP